MRVILSLIVLATACLLSSCRSESPSTKLLVVTNEKPLDTLQIITELQGLLSITAGPDVPQKRFTVTPVKDKDSLTFAIRPQLTDAHRSTVSELLDTLIQHPSSWTPGPLSLLYTDNSLEIVELLRLDTTKTYPLEIDHASARWTVEEKENYMVGPLASGAALSHLNYSLKNPLPASSYAMGLDIGADEGNEMTELFSSMLNTMGPFSSSFTIESDDSSISPLWDSLRVNHRMHIDSVDLSLHWAYIEFPYRKFHRYSDGDTMITSSIDELLKAPPYIFHTLIAPRFSGVIAGYRWDSL